MPPTCYLGTGEPSPRAGRAALADPKFAAVAGPKQRSVAPHPLLLPDPGGRATPGAQPASHRRLPGGAPSLQPAPSATAAKPRRPEPGEAAAAAAEPRGGAAPGLRSHLSRGAAGAKPQDPAFPPEQRRRGGERQSRSRTHEEAAEPSRQGRQRGR